MGCCCNDLLLGDPVVAPVPDCELFGTPPAINAFEIAIAGVDGCECSDFNRVHVCDTKINECFWSDNLPFYTCDSTTFQAGAAVRLEANIAGTLYRVWVQISASGNDTPTFGNVNSSAQWGVTTTLDFFEPFTLPLISTFGCATGWPSTITVVPVLP